MSPLSPLAPIPPFSRRRFLAGSALAASAGLSAGLPVGLAAQPPASPASASTVHELFPSQAPELVREMVRVAHFDPARVRELVGRQPALARAAWDWGYGDWESALGAASHVGNREIAQCLIANGARPDLFSAAMLGQLDAVKALVAACPGAQRIKGPHGITLLAHARAGGDLAKPVVAYLESLGDADSKPALQPLGDEERAALLGLYRFGKGPRDVFAIESAKGQLTVKRADGDARNLFHLGARAFYPAGAEAVRFRFSSETPAATLELHDPDRVLAGRREAAAAPLP